MDLQHGVLMLLIGIPLYVVLMCIILYVESPKKSKPKEERNALQEFNSRL